MADTTLDRVADVFIVHSLESFNAHGDLTDDGHELKLWSMLQEVIDNVNDHNELMLEAVGTVSPDLGALLHELMGSDLQNARQAWISLVATAFEAVGRKLGG